MEGSIVLKLYLRYVCIGEKKNSIYRIWYCAQFQASTEGLDTYSQGTRGVAGSGGETTI